MKFFILLLGLYFPVYGYFDGGLNHTTGKDGYSQSDLYIIVGSNNWWVRPNFYSWKSDSVDRINNFGLKLAFEKPSYTVGFISGYTPKKNDYESLSLGADITFSLNAGASNRKRIAGPNSGFVMRNASGVTQIDLGAQINFTSHKFSLTDDKIKETTASLFAGAKVFLTQVSLNWTVSSYDKEQIVKIRAPLTQKIYGLNSFFPTFIKSNFNAKVEIPGSPLVTPYLSYNKIKIKAGDTIDAYAFGAYIDLAMIGITTQFETYKDVSDKTQRYLSISGGLRF